jgi:tankyrase
VEYLLNLGAQIDSQDEGGLQPIHNSCSFGHTEVVRLLLSRGADPNAKDHWSYTGLHVKFQYFLFSLHIKIMYFLI